MGRRGHSKEVARAILFLSSEGLAQYITGATLVVDGGYLSSLTPEGMNPISIPRPDDPDS